MHSRRPALALVALAAGLAVASACSPAPRDPVEGLLSELESAAEARDADRVAARLGDAFHGPGGLGKPEALATLRRYFAGYESIGLELYEIDRQRQDGSAGVRLKVAFTGTARRAFGLEGLLPPSALYEFELEARDEGGTWRVTRASWQEVK